MCLAIPGQIRGVFESNGARMGKVNFGGVVKDVCLVYVPECCIDDFVIVHVGFAISKIDEASALKTLRLFEEMGILEEELSGDPTEPSGQACYVHRPVPAAEQPSSNPKRPG
jgi:hydrogenase expression/formation protein HypC